MRKPYILKLLANLEICWYTIWCNFLAIPRMTKKITIVLKGYRSLLKLCRNKNILFKQYIQTLFCHLLKYVVLFSIFRQ